MPASEIDKAVRSLTDGQFHVEIVGGVLFLVKSSTSESVNLSQIRRVSDSDASRLERVKTFSPRELQVFTMLGEGLEMAEIAERLEVSVKTAETFRARLKQKLDIERRSHLLMLAVEWKLLNSHASE